MNYNKVIILGNLTRDPQKRETPTGIGVADFSIATNRFYTDKEGKKEETEFHQVVVFGKLADVAYKFLKKGTTCLIEGSLQTRSWQDATGLKHFKTEIIAENLQF